MDGPLNDQEETHALRLRNAGQAILNALRATVEHCDISSKAYLVTSRVKRESRMYEKVHQKIADGKTNYRISCLTDIVGIRFISLYKEAVASLVKETLSLITGTSVVNPNNFLGGRVAEFIVYVSNVVPETDPLTAEIKSIYEAAFEGKPPALFRAVAGRYSSVHMVVWLNHEEDGITTPIPLEIQLRSAFEDVWGEIDHKLYLENTRQGRENQQAKREIIAQHMNVLKRIMDAAAEYADVVRRTLVISPAQPVTIQRSLDAIGYLGDICAQADMLPLAREELVSLVSEKEALDAAIEGGEQAASKQQYVALADRFGEYLAKFGPLMLES